MSKGLKVLLAIVMFGLLTTGCSVKTEYPVNGAGDVAAVPNSREQGIIKAMDFDDAQKKIISGMGANQSDIFYFQYEGIPEQDNWLEVWIDSYEKGQKVNKLFSINQGVSGSGNILCMFEDVDSKTRIVLNGSSLLKEQPKTEQRATTNKKNVKPIAVNTDTPFLLAIRVLDESNHSAIIPDEIFTDQNLAEQELAQYDYVYLLKGRFYKSNT